MDSLLISQAGFIALLVIGIATFVTPFIIWAVLNLSPNLAKKLPVHKAKFVSMMALTGILLSFMCVGIVVHFIVI